MLQPGRNVSAANYRYGFNGKEQDSAVNGVGVDYDYGARIYDARMGRFLSMDPLIKKYPWYTPYQFAGNKPIWAIDLDGLEELISTASIKYRVNYNSTEHEYFNKGYDQNIYASRLTNANDASIKISVIGWRADSDEDRDGSGAMPGKANTDQKVTSFGTKYGKELDASTVPYGVIPGGVHKEALSKEGVVVGDLYITFRIDKGGMLGGALSVGILGDVGPQGQPGEQSTYANKQTNNGNGVESNEYVFIAFANTAKYWIDIVGTDKKGKINSAPTAEQINQAIETFVNDYLPDFENANFSEFLKIYNTLLDQEHKKNYDNATLSEKSAAIKNHTEKEKKTPQKK